MSSARRAGPKLHVEDGQKARDGKAAGIEFLPPPKPRPLLAVGLLLVLVLWLGALVVMRFTSVKPYVNPAPAPATR